MFLSFIVPVYNTEEYLDDCLRSLLDQDFHAEDYEIVCINDGSTDNSLRILRNYEKAYANIRVIDQENGGVCKARNTGLLAAKGDYIWYIDADDFVRKNCLGELFRRLRNTAADRLIIDHFTCVDTSNDKEMKVNTSWKDSVVWRSIFRRDFLIGQDLLFHYPELTFGEDALYLYEVKRAIPVTAEFASPLYYHRVHPGSLSTEMNTDTESKRLKCNIREAQIMKDYYEQGGILEQETEDRFYSFLRGALYRISLMPRKNTKQYLRDLKKAGLYPYRSTNPCPFVKCPEINRNDFLGKILDTLYTNLSSCWGYHGMRFVHKLIQVKSILSKALRR